MTVQAKSVLSNLKRLSHDSECLISYLGDTTCFCLVDDYNKTYDYQKYLHEIGGILDMLADEGYIYFDGNKRNFHLSQKAIHKKQITLSAVVSFLRDKFIDILALVIAFLALLNSYGYNVLAPLIALCRKLLELR